MSSNRRRAIIIFVSVGIGSLLALYFMKRRLSTLSADSYKQLVLNYIFAVAIVVGVGILLKKNRPPKDKE